MTMLIMYFGVLNMTKNKLKFIPDLMFQGLLALKTDDLSDNQMRYRIELHSDFVLLRSVILRSVIYILLFDKISLGFVYEVMFIIYCNFKTPTSYMIFYTLALYTKLQKSCFAQFAALHTSTLSISLRLRSK